MSASTPPMAFRSEHLSPFLPWRDEDRQPQIIARGEQSVIFSGKPLSHFGHRPLAHARVDADDFQRSRQSRQMLIEPKQPPTERPQLLGDGRPLHKARVVNQHRQRRSGHILAIEIS